MPHEGPHKKKKITTLYKGSIESESKGTRKGQTREEKICVVPRQLLATRNIGKIRELSSLMRSWNLAGGGECPLTDICGIYNSLS